MPDDVSLVAAAAAEAACITGADPSIVAAIVGSVVWNFVARQGASSVVAGKAVAPVPNGSVVAGKPAALVQSNVGWKPNEWVWQLGAEEVDVAAGPSSLDSKMAQLRLALYAGRTDEVCEVEEPASTSVPCQVWKPSLWRVGASASVEIDTALVARDGASGGGSMVYKADYYSKASRRRDAQPLLRMAYDCATPAGAAIS